jgi:hypothetical protein
MKKLFVMKFDVMKMNNGEIIIIEDQKELEKHK